MSHDMQVAFIEVKEHLCVHSYNLPPWHWIHFTFICGFMSPKFCPQLYHNFLLTRDLFSFSFLWDGYARRCLLSIFLIFFPQKSFRDLLRKQEGDRALWEYPFAVAGVNITFMLIQILDLEAVKPRTLVGATFLKFLAENESAFDLLYCIAFKLMDHQWLAMHASYMDFNTVMKATRRHLETELLQENITRLEDLPSYGLLSR
ncbi:Hypothetical predicted protein [Olea europaea subsp. europaea]|uniref:ELMO domain-containing protein n=1 Tax=Olea europaea subsp. europaea TaxID=158383 RepID=A0A8S0RTM8_OLEEU|nr:Hypothetical predicted protein [Olea europaea subsp. europaea]